MCKGAGLLKRWDARSGSPDRPDRPSLPGHAADMHGLVLEMVVLHSGPTVFSLDPHEDMAP